MKTFFALSLAALATLATTGAYANCTDLGERQGQVDKLCKPASKITCSKTPAKTAEEYDALKAAGTACKNARVAVNKCFNPPDQGHLDAVKVVGEAVANCNQLANNARSTAKIKARSEAKP